MATTLNPNGDSRLWKWLRKVSPYSKELAWCHTTDAYRLRTIIEQGHLTPQRCNVFKEDLLYLFYGRPAFRREEDKTLRQGAKAPVVIVFSPNLISKGVRLFPFDSGAFKDRYTDWMHASMQLDHFELKCSIDVPQRHVAAFFRTNTEYMRLNSTAPKTPYVGEFEVEAIVNMLADSSATSADDRRLAVELQVGEKIQFDNSSILALIVPDEIQQAPFFNNFFSTYGKGIQLVTYRFAALRNAGHYQSKLEDSAYGIQQELGYI